MATMNRSNGTLRVQNKREYIYMVTIRKFQVKDFVSSNELINIQGYVMQYLNYQPTFRHTVFEVDKKYMQLHMHFIVKSNKKICFKNICRYNQFRIYWVPVYSIKNVIMYLEKDVYNMYMQGQLIDTNYYKNNYGFI